MKSDKEILSKIVSERADKIQSEALEQITHIQESRERELARIVPDLMKQIEVGFKRLDVLDIMRNGGMVKTGECETRYNDAHWRLEIDGADPFSYEAYQNRLAKGRYRITLIMEKLKEE